MPQPPCGKRESAVFPVPQSATNDYKCPAEEHLDGGAIVDGLVTIEALRSGTQSGGSITAAVVTLRTAPAEQNQYRMFLRCSWLPGAFYGVAVHRGKALRAHKTYDAWAQLLSQFGYQGPVTVYYENDPGLAELGISTRPTE